MRYIDGSIYYTVSEVAEAAGVSPQTIRLWEGQGELRSRRTPGGHRLFDEQTLRQAQNASANRRRAGDEPKTTSSSTADPIASWELGATGARIKGARMRAALSQHEVAKRAGISRSMLSAVERGETGVSMFVFAKLAEVLGLAASDLAPQLPVDQMLIRADDRPRTVLADGVAWEEMSPPGRPLSAAYLFVPAHAGSGGPVMDPHDTFVTVQKGRLRFTFADGGDAEVVRSGDGLTLRGARTYEWRNDSARPCVAMWLAYHPERENRPQAVDRFSGGL